jgi:hypothetical protein
MTAYAVERAGVNSTPPVSISNLAIVERVQGTSVTDFGAPSASPGTPSITHRSWRIV